MLKGVNKLIIEVSNPESELFERAIFFVKPEKQGIVYRELGESVSSIMGSAENIHQKPARAKSRALLKLAGAAGAGAIVAGVLMRLWG
jgi:hypothetical protein